MLPQTPSNWLVDVGSPQSARPDKRHTGKPANKKRAGLTPALLGYVMIPICLHLGEAEDVALGIFEEGALHAVYIYNSVYSLEPREAILFKRHSLAA